MNVKNCSKCGKLFNYVMGPPICTACRKSLEDQFTDVRKFVRKNPEATIPEVAETCGTDIRQIRQWIREERLSFSENSAIGIECENCGKNIRTGRYCEGCKSELASELKSVQRKPEKEENEFKDQKKETKMRFLDRNDL